MKSFLFGILALSYLTSHADHVAHERGFPICYLVTSYTYGYAWQDEIVDELNAQLENTCTVIEYELNSGGVPQNVAVNVNRATDLMDVINPDVLITTDNAAYTYFYKNQDIQMPTFSLGLNWPPDDIKGNIVAEDQGIDPMLKDPFYSGIKSIKLLDGLTETATKNALNYKKVFESEGIKFNYCLTDNAESWKKKFSISQGYDMILLQSNHGIKDWDKYDIQRFVERETKTKTISFNSAMLPYSMHVYEKSGAEQAWLLSNEVKRYFRTGKARSKVQRNTQFVKYTNNELLTTSADLIFE